MEPSDNSLSQSNIEMLLTVVKDENAELKAKMKRMAEAGPEEWKAVGSCSTFLASESGRGTRLIREPESRLSSSPSSET